MDKKSFLRDVTGEYMVTLGARDDRVTVVNADLAGTCRNRGFGETYPDRVFNVGIAEQNMVSFAAGLAAEGYIPYTFSMAPFLTMRACEQCRTDVAYGNRSVRLMGVYAGVSGGISGATHWAIEDVGIMTSIPGIDVYELSDANQAKRLLDMSLMHNGPMYIRTSVEPVTDLYPEDIEVSRGGSTLVCEGEDGAFLCSGVIVQYAKKAAEMIKEKNGATIRVIDMYSIKPIDREAIISASGTGRIVVAQDHNIVGGLGSIVATTLATEGIGVRFKIVGIPDEYVAMAHPGYLYNKFGLDAEGLCKTMTEMLN
ncbi:MAG: transketolase family protein [Lachnospiraceae bacterium]|nr:transketolase family protein [Candidatus Colinaster scatohippi]